MINKDELLKKINFESFYSLFIPSLKTKGGFQASGLCPFHDDHNPSLSVNLQNGLWKCFASCGGGDFFNFYQRLKNVDFNTAMKEVLEMQGMANCSVKPKTVATFEYKDSSGKKLYLKERIEPGREGRSKEFFFKHTVGNKLVNGRGCNSIPYSLPELINAKEVFVVEGEAKVEGLRKLGFVATCLDSGAESPWKEEYLKFFEGKRKVILLPDNDDAGKSYALKIANALYQRVEIVKIVELPGLKEKGDIIDWLDIRDEKETEEIRKELDNLIETAEEWSPKNEDSIISCKTKIGKESNFCPLSVEELYKEVTESIQWTWEFLIPEGSLWLLSAYMKVGKSEFAYRLAVSIAKGEPFLSYKTKQGAVLILALEEHKRDVVHRLHKLAVNPHDPIYVQSGKLDYSEEIVFSIKEYINEKDVILVIVDTVSRFWNIKDENDNAEILRTLSPLLDLAHETNTSIGFIHHENKSGGDGGRSIRGGSAIFGIVDQAILLERRQGGDKNDRVLRTIGRYSESPGELIITLKDNEYKLLGTSEELNVQGYTSKVCNVLSGVPKTIEQLAKEANLSSKLVRVALDNLSEFIDRDGSGVKNDPYKYYLLGNSILSQTEPLGEETNLKTETSTQSNVNL